MSTIANTVTHTPRQYPWAWEVPVTFTTSDGRKLDRVLVFTEGEPDSKEIAAAAAARAAKLEATVESPCEDLLLRPDVEALLVAKGYLTADQSLEDLPDKTKESG